MIDQIYKENYHILPHITTLLISFSTRAEGLPDNIFQNLNEHRAPRPAIIVLVQFTLSVSLIFMYFCFG